MNKFFTPLEVSSKNRIVTHFLDNQMLVKIIIMIERDRNKMTAPKTNSMIKLFDYRISFP